MPTARRCLAAAVVIAAAAASGVARAGDPPTGTFVGDAVRLEVRADGLGGYAGRITFQGKTYPFNGRADDATVTGQFASDGNAYPVRIEPRGGGGVTLTSGSNVFALAAVAPAGVVPAAPAAAFPAGYDLVKSTRAGGRAVTVAKAGVARPTTALRLALADLFGTDYQVTASFIDRRDERSALAAATATYGGRRVKVLLASKVTAGGAVVDVAFCPADATAADWAELTGVDRRGGMEAAIANVRLREYRFPDGTGLVGLAEGYQTDAPSCQAGFTVTGPAGQQVVFGESVTVNLPASAAVRNERAAEQAGMQPFPMVVAPLLEPADAVATLMPQFDRIRRQRGLSTVAVDHLCLLAPMRPATENGRAAALAFGLTSAEPGERPRHYQTFARVNVEPGGGESWLYLQTTARAPDRTAARDMPVLLATINSWQTNDRAIEANTAAWVAASHRAYDAARTANRELQAVYAGENAAWRADGTATARSVDDYVETIRGWTEVADTMTGERAQADLGNVNETVDRLNAVDPGRYVQVPLRDDADPLP